MTEMSDGFRTAFRGHPAGVALITARSPVGPVGLTASSVASVSAEPAALSFSVAKPDGSAGRVLAARTFLVHLLAEGHEGLARSFAVSGSERFTREQGWDALDTGEPHLPSAPYALRARALEIVPIGSSRLVLAEILSVHEGGSRPGDSEGRLVYQDRRFHTLPPAQVLAAGSA